MSTPIAPPMSARDLALADLFARDLYPGHVIVSFTSTGRSEATVAHVTHDDGKVIVKTTTGARAEYADDDVVEIQMPVPSSIPKFAQERREGFNYLDGSLHGRGGITPTSAPCPERFTWGKVLRVHIVGDDYAIVEHIPRQARNVSDEDYDPSPSFSLYVRGAGVNGKTWDTGHSYKSFDKALIAAVAWKHEQAAGDWSAAANSSAVQYICKMLGIGANS